jgi:rhamnogalacturonan acetylesterase
MQKRIHLLAVLAILLSAVARAQPPTPSAAAHYTLDPNLPTLWIVGASAVRNGHDKGENGQWGWGNPIGAFFDRSRINVIDYALGGTSTRTYMALGLWDHALADMKPGDYLLIQFGSNDSSPINDALRARGTIPGNGEETQEIDNLRTKKHEVVHTYGWYIRKYLTDAKAKGVAAEIVLSPDPKNTWKDGKVGRADNFIAWDQAAAAQENALFVDVNARIAQAYDAAGQDFVTQTYFPVGETEHTDWVGSIFNARCIVAGIRNLPNCSLVGYLLPTTAPDPPLPSGKAR